MRILLPLHAFGCVIGSGAPRKKPTFNLHINDSGYMVDEPELSQHPGIPEGSITAGHGLVIVHRESPNFSGSVQKIELAFPDQNQEPDITSISPHEAGELLIFHENLMAVPLDISTVGSVGASAAGAFAEIKCMYRDGSPMGSVFTLLALLVDLNDRRLVIQFCAELHQKRIQLGKRLFGPTRALSPSREDSTCTRSLTPTVSGLSDSLEARVCLRGPDEDGGADYLSLRRSPRNNVCEPIVFVRSREHAPLTGEAVARLVWDLPDQLSPTVDERVPCFKSSLNRAELPLHSDVEIKHGPPADLKVLKSVYLCTERGTGTVFAEYEFQHNPFSTKGPKLFGQKSLSSEAQHELFQKGEPSSISYCNFAYQLMTSNALIHDFVHM